MTHHFTPDKHTRIRERQRDNHRKKQPPFHAYYYPEIYDIFAYFLPITPKHTSFLGVNLKRGTDPKPFFDTLQMKLGVAVTYMPGVTEMWNARLGERVEIGTLEAVLKEIREEYDTESS